ncbi:MAG: ferric reductase-like transmembrane domain-containing protein [Actinomycetota bacterium]
MRQNLTAEDLATAFGEAPLWYINRGTGVVLLVLYTLSLTLGMVATTRFQNRWWPRFVTQGLHRNIAFLALALLVVHAGSSIVDEYVDIRWWHAFIPVGATYEPVWLGLGTVASNLMVATILTSVVRHRIGHRWWLSVHLTTYPGFMIGVIHGLGMGTDAGESWSVITTIGCIALVVVAMVIRLIVLTRPEPSPVPLPHPRAALTRRQAKAARSHRTRRTQ